MLQVLGNVIKRPSGFDKAAAEPITAEKANASKTFDQDPYSDCDKMEDVVTATDFDFSAFSRNTLVGRLIDS